MRDDDLIFEAWADARRAHFETYAEGVFKGVTARVTDPALLKLWEAMRYAVLCGGKRVRALLVYAAGHLTQASCAALDAAALAVESVHAYSLVHDDLPAMDNDTLRRGKPTCHVKFGEAQAMLAGDALQPFAFSLLASLPVSDASRVAVMAELARASGAVGMCGGQMIDLESVGKRVSAETLRRMHEMKTGALIAGSVVIGAHCGTAERIAAALPALKTYSKSLGLAFQVIDDILDVTADTATLGKTAGKDAAENKPTYVTLLGLEEATALAKSCRNDALDALRGIETDEEGLIPPRLTRRLAETADYIVGRTF